VSQARLIFPPLPAVGRRAFASAVLSSLVFGAVCVSAPAMAAEEQPGARKVPPGVLVEPRPRPVQPSEREVDQPPSGRDRRDDRRGCPTNEQPLELLV